MGKEQLSKLYMGNLNPKAREVEVRKFLSEHGISTSLITGFSLKKGFAVISVSSQAAADKIIDKIHGIEFQGNKLILEPSFSGTSNSRIKTNSTTTVSTGNENPLKILVPTIYVGAVIGRGGASIKETTKTTGARINVLRTWPDSNEKIIAIIGSQSNCSSACKRILELCELEHTACGGQEVCLKIFAADNQIGRIIGKEGKSIKKIMQDTQTKIHVSNQVEQDSRIITIRGTIDGMSKAETLISSKLQTVSPQPNYHHGSSSHINYQHHNYPINFRSSGMKLRPMTGTPSFTDQLSNQFYPMSKNPVSSGMDLNMYTAYSRGQYH